MPTQAEGLGLTVNSPCAASWESMAGNEQVRFCEHCEKSVHNLSAMTRKRALRLVRANDGGLCVRFHTDPNGRTLHEPEGKLHSITRRASSFAAGAFGAFVALGATALAQSPSPDAGREVVLGRIAARADAEAARASLTGTVLDPNGALVKGASVMIMNTKTYQILTATTNDEGVYHFDSLAPGTYFVEFKAEGFDAERFEKVELQQGVEQRQDSMLSLPGAKPAKAEEEQAEEEEDESEEGASCANAAGEESKSEVADAEADAAEEGNEITDLPLNKEGEVRRVRLAVMGDVAMIAPSNPLIKAISERDARAAKNLIALGADVNVLDKSAHTTALMMAVSNNDAEMVSALIAAGADVNMKDTDGDTALTSLAEGATVEMARALIHAGAKVNHKNDYGETPLIGAAENDTPEVLKELLEAGAKVNAKNKSGRTALMAAAEYGLIENVKLLLNAGADVNLKDKEYDTALTLAKDYGAEVLDDSEEDDAEEGEESKQSARSNQSKKAKEPKESEESKLSKKIVALLISYGAVE